MLNLLKKYLKKHLNVCIKRKINNLKRKLTLSFISNLVVNFFSDCTIKRCFLTKCSMRFSKLSVRKEKI